MSVSTLTYTTRTGMVTPTTHPAMLATIAAAAVEARIRLEEAQWRRTHCQADVFDRAESWWDMCCTPLVEGACPMAHRHIGWVQTGTEPKWVLVREGLSASAICDKNALIDGYVIECDSVLRVEDGSCPNASTHA